MGGSYLTLLKLRRLICSVGTWSNSQIIISGVIKMPYKQNSRLRRRIYKSTEWLLDKQNCHLQKISIKAIGIIIVSLVGFTAKGIFDNYRESLPNFTNIIRGIEFAVPWVPLSPLNKDPALAGALLLLALSIVILLFFAVSIGLATYKATQLSKLPHDEYCKPSQFAKSFLNDRMGETSEEYRIVGSAIEIARHPHLVSDPSISGWDCLALKGQNGTCDVRIEHDGGLAFDFDNKLIEDIPAPLGANNRKYCLIKTPIDYLDASAKLNLTVHSTDYATVDSFGQIIRQNQEKRHMLASLYPEFHGIPNSLCLHFLVQLADGNILCMLRKENSDYARGKVSFTGEEQFSQEDMDAGPDFAMNHWFRRAICEEIFPLRATDSGMLERNWAKISGVVTAMRIFSVFYEEEYANYSLLGFAKLDLDVDEFRNKVESLSRLYMNGRDKEGQYFLMDKAQAIGFIETGTASLQPLWGNIEPIVLGDPKYQLHGSSRYRLLTFLLCTGALTGKKSASIQIQDYPIQELEKLKSELKVVTRHRNELLLASRNSEEAKEIAI